MTEIAADRRLLWPEGAPQATGGEAIDCPALTVHLPEPEYANGAGIIVNPGGGYRVLASDHEGLQVARWLNRAGIAAFVLRYRVGPKYHSDVSLLDGLRAVRYVRAHAVDWGVAPDRLGMLGFSAGGHLVAAVGTRWDSGQPDSRDAVERESSRPDFLVPVYAVINGRVRGRKADEYTPADERVTADTPPAFIVHTHEDKVVSAEQSLLLYKALLDAGVEAELHVFGFGEHGLGLGVGDPDLNRWPRLLLRWLRRCGFLTDEERTAVSGRVTLDGKPMGMAWVTFLPDDERAPIARVRIHRDSNGAFEIPADVGPVPGPHRVEVHHVSEQIPHTNTGGYSMDDAVRYETRAMVEPGAYVALPLVSEPTAAL
ncbi:MAG: alpha/beta hydrolase [Gammaproteobacteria bacterium]|nr:alpha/beta hydrolase [Gammaproteobacteria bacterium]